MVHQINIGELLKCVAQVRLEKQDLLKKLNYSRSILGFVEEITNSRKQIKEMIEETENNWNNIEQLWKTVNEQSKYF